MYGSPNIDLSNKSLGKPGPSSFIIISVSLLLSCKKISTVLSLNLFAFPIKFLNPYTISGDFLNLFFLLKFFHVY